MGDTKVLFVDDEIKILNSIRRGVISENYTGIFANSGKDALEIMEKEEIAVIVTDMRMPEMNGLELLEKVKEKYPNTIRIVLSGFSQLSQVLATVNQVGVFKYISKPWDLEQDFLVGIRQAVDYYNLQKDHKALKIALEKKNVLYQNMLRSFEEKTFQNKKNFDKFLKVNDFFIKSIIVLNSKLGEDKNNYIPTYISTIKEFYPLYIDSILSNVIEFNFDKISFDLNNIFVKTFDLEKITFQFINDNYFSVKGNYKLYHSVIITLIKFIIENFCKEINMIISVSFSSEIKDNSSVCIKTKVNFITNRRETLNVTALNIICMLLNEVLKNISGSVYCSGNSYKDLEINLSGEFEKLPQQ